MVLFFVKVKEMKNAGSDFTHETVPCPENKIKTLTLWYQPCC